MSQQEHQLSREDHQRLMSLYAPRPQPAPTRDDMERLRIGVKNLEERERRDTLRGIANTVERQHPGSSMAQALGKSVEINKKKGTNVHYIADAINKYLPNSEYRGRGKQKTSKGKTSKGKTSKGKTSKGKTSKRKSRKSSIRKTKTRKHRK